MSRERAALSIGTSFGLVLGAAEALFVASTSAVPGTFASGLLLGLIAAALPGVLGAALARVLMPVARRNPWEPDALGLHAGLVATGLACAWGLPAAAELWSDGSRLLAVPLALLPFAFGLAAGLWTRFVLDSDWHWPDRPLTVGGVASGLLIVATAGVTEWRSDRRPDPRDGPSVVLITLDTFRRDALGAVGDGPSVTPNLDRLASEGLLFLDAVAPMPETAPSHASMLTGLHPLRHRVISNGHQLDASFQTVPEVLSERGWATGAFVSSFAVDDRTGLSQGFAVYDDALAPGPAGLWRLRAFHVLARAWMVLGDPARTPWLLERDGDVTIDRFEGWLDETPGAFFAWVHLFETHAPYEPPVAAGVPPALDHRARMGQTEFTPAEIEQLRALYQGEVKDVDRLVGRVAEALAARGRLERTMIVVVGDHGEMLGEHGLTATHVGLWEEVVRVPLIVRVPQSSPDVPRVEAQVRVYDVAPTIYEYLAVDGVETEGLPLLEYGTGRRAVDLGTALVGRRARSFADGALIGVRAQGTKYVRDLVTGDETLFLVREDPAEADDRLGFYRDESPESLQRVRGAVDPDAKAFELLLREDLPDLPLADAQMLEQLGYQR
jgi:arylsulfatase A-like enzyme